MNVVADVVNQINVKETKKRTLCCFSSWEWVSNWRWALKWPPGDWMALYGRWMTPISRRREDGRSCRVERAFFSPLKRPFKFQIEDGAKRAGKRRVYVYGLHMRPCKDALEDDKGISPRIPSPNNCRSFRRLFVLHPLLRHYVNKSLCFCVWPYYFSSLFVFIRV